MKEPVLLPALDEKEITERRTALNNAIPAQRLEGLAPDRTNDRRFLRPPVD
jgi:hypothetical protein